MKIYTYILILLIITTTSIAKVDLVSLPQRDSVQLTIYNSADLTLARESRYLTMKEGVNKLQFSWENTLIDPTSLDMISLKNADSIDVAEIIYPPRVNNLGLWNVQSEIADSVPMEISYLTSGLSWRAFYMGTLTEDESAMNLKGYVIVTNNSGEDYENAQVRLIVGKVNIIDQIADLARRQQPYGRPGDTIESEEALRGRVLSKSIKRNMPMRAAGVAYDAKDIVKEGLSEYFLYTIEGTETITNGYSKRLSSFEAGSVPVENLYKFELERYGTQPVRFLSFKNDTAHDLGDTPIPGGLLKVYRNTSADGHLSYEGQSDFKYIPVEEDVELNLGSTNKIVVEPEMVDFTSNDFLYDKDGNITGWTETKKFKYTLTNTRNIKVKLDIRKNIGGKWTLLDKTGDYGKYSKVDEDTIRFELNLEPETKSEFEVTIKNFIGSRAD